MGDLTGGWAALSAEESISMCVLFNVFCIAEILMLFKSTCTTIIGYLPVHLFLPTQSIHNDKYPCIHPMRQHHHSWNIKRSHLHNISHVRHKNMFTDNRSRSPAVYKLDLFL